MGEHGHTEPEPVKKPKKKKHDISGVSSVGLTSDVPLNSHEFNKFMHGIIKDHKENLYRTKGVVALAGEGDTKFVFQGVHDQIQFTPAKEPWAPNECKQSKVVFIGRHLEPEVLKSGSEIRPGPALLLTPHYLPMRPNGVGRVGWKGCTPREQTARPHEVSWWWWWCGGRSFVCVTRGVCGGCGVSAGE